MYLHFVQFPISFLLASGLLYLENPSPLEVGIRVVSEITATLQEVVALNSFQ